MQLQEQQSGKPQVGPVRHNLTGIFRRLRHRSSAVLTAANGVFPDVLQAT